MIPTGVLPSTLTNFLVLNMPKTKDSKKPKFALGVQEPRLGSAIQESLKVRLGRQRMNQRWRVADDAG